MQRSELQLNGMAVVLSVARLCTLMRVTLCAGGGLQAGEPQHCIAGRLL